MRLQVSKWGNSLAVRLPVECVRAAGLRAGDSVEANITSAGEIMLIPDRVFSKVTFLQRLAVLQLSMPMGDSVIDELRRGGPY